MEVHVVLMILLLHLSIDVVLWLWLVLLVIVVKFLVLVHADMRLVIRLQIVSNGHIWYSTLSHFDVMYQYVLVITHIWILASKHHIFLHAVQKVVTSRVLNHFRVRIVVI